ncbi:putative 3-oxo-5-alpha-steroid 4-dehydrogenase [Cladorrhinum samala]|uniref:3-oxo-5-alpha-steroid 4-dehydrogenase n=1 Tax=Cladorrhinum samala TaxID=585594 RepID=A0AAV9HCJ5_9PEZI|nr:putative 3-oxo-5-alpha-steroid 4-dehydrogenase [Cladorrhinum samala]
MAVGLIPGYFPPSKENYDLLLAIWKWFPVFASIQWLTAFYAMGKTSLPTSRLNLPGRWAWLTMESPGFVTLLYNYFALSRVGGGIVGEENGSPPWRNKVLVALFVIHYAYRAVVYPFIQPSMSPIHAIMWCFAIVFQIVNGTLIGSWLGRYHNYDYNYYHGASSSSSSSIVQFSFGVAIFYLGLAANYYHDEELREIRRREIRRREKLELVKQREEKGESGNQNGKNGEKKKKKTTIEKHYEIPTAGLFRYVLYPHYLVEWVEWFGFWMACGWDCAPAMMFLVNEVFSMLPRAVRGKRWYVEKFGREKVGRRWAVIPGVW